jgi:hypothetical protein
MKFILRQINNVPQDIIEMMLLVILYRSNPWPKSLTMSNDFTYFCFTFLWLYCQYLYNYIFPRLVRPNIQK